MDIYEEVFLKQKEILLNCQKTKNQTSCYGCSETFNCKLKRNYIKAAYEKMNKGRTGGFDFS